MSTSVTVQAMLNLAGFPLDEVRKVENTDTVKALVQAGYLQVVPARSEAASGAAEGSVAGAEPSAGPVAPPAAPEGSKKPSKG